MSDFQGRLLAWYHQNKRELPWRQTRDPYAIWVSEIMLQQTTVKAVIPFYERWMARFPDVGALASASMDEVLTYWQGLGYYRRCRMLHAGAVFVLEQGFPTCEAEWRKVPGVGEYTAAAISSIAFGERVALVDGNVERVFVRLNCDEAQNLKATAWRWVREVLAEDAGSWNQALMELGATVCIPRAPLCSSCPVVKDCCAFSSGRQNELPMPKNKTEWKELTHHIWIPLAAGRVGIRQIPAGEWWEGMWEFARSEDFDSLSTLLNPEWIEEAGSFRHVVTRHKIRAVVAVARNCQKEAAFRWVLPEELEGYAMPSPQRRAWKMASGLQ